MAKVRESAIVAAAQLLQGPQMPSDAAPRGDAVSTDVEGRSAPSPPDAPPGHAEKDPAEPAGRRVLRFPVTVPHRAEQVRHQRGPSTWRAAMQMGLGAGCGFILAVALIAYSDPPLGTPAEGPEAGRAVAPAVQVTGIAAAGDPEAATLSDRAQSGRPAEMAAAGTGAQRVAPADVGSGGGADSEGVSVEPSSAVDGATNDRHGRSAELGATAGASTSATVAAPLPSEAEPMADDDDRSAVAKAMVDARNGGKTDPENGRLPGLVAAIGPARARDEALGEATLSARGRADDIDVLDPRIGRYAIAVPAPAARDPAAAEEALALSRRDRLVVQRRLVLARSGLRMVDGIFGPRTRAAITAWQASAGLPETGYLDETSLARLQQATDRDYREWRLRQAARLKQERAQQENVAARAPRATDDCRREASGKIVYGRGVRCDFRGLQETLQGIFR